MGLRGAALMSQQNSSDKQNSDYGLRPEKMEMLLLFKRILTEFVSLEKHPFTKCYNKPMMSCVTRIPIPLHLNLNLSSFQWSRGSEVSDASWFEGRTTFICNSDKNSQATSLTYSAAQATVAMLKVV